MPKNDTNLRIRYDCSLLCFELPTQNTASGPDSLRIASSLSPTSLIAWSQLIFWYLPLTSFIGDFSAMRVLVHAVLADRRALRAMRAEVERRIEHRLLPHPHAVLDRRRRSRSPPSSACRRCA